MTAPPRRSARSAALLVFGALAICGAVLGAVWVRIAPPIHTMIGLTTSGERVDAYLGREADNLFVAAAMMVGLLAWLAIVSAVLVWQWRAHRGPLLAAALSIGQVAAAAAATGTGAALAHWRYGTPDRAGAQLSPQNRVAYFTEAPPVFLGNSPFQVAVTLLLPAALAATVYAVLTIATPLDDLGAWPPQRTGRLQALEPPFTPQASPPIRAAGTEPARPS